MKKKDKKVICITGPAGSGKTTLSNLLKDKGYYVINVDTLGHRALDIAKKQITRTFGDVLDEDGKVMRDKLRKRLQSKEEWKKLEEITHPVIRKLLKDKIESTKSNKIIVDAAIPFTLKIEDLCDIIIKIDAPYEVLVKRLKGKGLESKFIENILKKQEQEYRMCDFIITNNGTLEDFLKKALHLLESL